MRAIFHYRRAYATYALAAINLLLFLFVLAQGEAEVDRFYRRVSVLLPQGLGSLEWWKLLAANFVHLSVTHLAINMVILCVFAPFVEFELGLKKFLLLYLVCGVAALLMVVVYAILFDLYVPALRVRKPQLIGGASAAILGILGARGALFLRTWWREHSAVARNHFILMLLLVIFQAGSDLLRFNVAFGAHLTSAIIGFALGLLLTADRVSLAGANPFSLTGAVKQSGDTRQSQAAPAV